MLVPRLTYLIPQIRRSFPASRINCYAPAQRDGSFIVDYVTECGDSWEAATPVFFAHYRASYYSGRAASLLPMVLPSQALLPAPIIALPIKWENFTGLNHLR